MTEEISIPGLIPDFSIFTSEDNLEAFLLIAGWENIKKIPVSSRLYYNLKEKTPEKTLTLIGKWERKRVSLEWIKELQKYCEMFVPCNEIMKSDEYVERWNKLPEKVKSQIEVLVEKSKQNPLSEILVEMLTLSFITDFPVVAFSRQFQRQLRRLEVPALDTLIPCVEHLKRLHRKKNGWYKRLSEWCIRARGRKLPIGKIILVTVAVGISLASWKVMDIILSLDFFAMNEVTKETFEAATGVFIGTIIVNGFSV